MAIGATTFSATSFQPAFATSTTPSVVNEQNYVTGATPSPTEFSQWHDGFANAFSTNTSAFTEETAFHPPVDFGVHSALAFVNGFADELAEKYGFPFFNAGIVSSAAKVLEQPVRCHVFGLPNKYNDTIRESAGKRDVSTRMVEEKMKKRDASGRILDLSHVISPNMPVYPGTETPVFISKNTLKKDGFKEVQVAFYTHTGTHIDFPSHLMEGRVKTLSNYGVGSFYGKGVVIDCSTYGEGKRIPLAHVKRYEKEIKDAEFVLFCTGWDKYWKNSHYFKKFPVITREVAEYLSRFKIKGVGVDTISIDAIDSKELETHRIFLAKGIFIIENLKGLKRLINTRFNFACFPLKLKELDGSPIRAVAFIL